MAVTRGEKRLINVWVSEELVDLFDAAAEEKGVSRSRLIREATTQAAAETLTRSLSARTERVPA